MVARKVRGLRKPNLPQILWFTLVSPTFLPFFPALSFMFLFPGPVCSIIYSVQYIHWLMSYMCVLVIQGWHAFAHVKDCAEKMHEGTWFAYGSVRVSM